MSYIKYIKPENSSGISMRNIERVVPVIKGKDFIVDNNVTVGGDAPKDFIRVYKYGEVRRSKRKKWIKYIAKTGHKWYPNESISEHLLNCIGKELGLIMSDSELAMISGQLRFLSRYFLDSKSQELVHGVDIFAGFIADREFVEEVENNRLARAFFTFQFAADAIKFAFPEDYQNIIDSFVKLLVFDAIVGNNDRHFYNWGVVKYIKNNKRPYFSPVFDTARGLFWNESEEKVVGRVKQSGQLGGYLNKYINNSFPKIGWEGESNLNHIELVNRIRQLDKRYAVIIDELLDKDNEKQVIDMIHSKFKGLLGAERLILISKCLALRFELLRK